MDWIVSKDRLLTLSYNYLCLEKIFRLIVFYNNLKGYSSQIINIIRILN